MCSGNHKYVAIFCVCLCVMCVKDLSLRNQKKNGTDFLLYLDFYFHFFSLYIIIASSTPPPPTTIPAPLINLNY